MSLTIPVPFAPFSQDCLSGDGKALMFVNLSPTTASANETVCSLRFANQVTICQLKRLHSSSLNGSHQGCEDRITPPK